MRGCRELYAESYPLDMEVASAGDAGADLVKFSLEMAARFPVASRWWQPFFRGYGEPDFAQLRLRLLACDEPSFRCLGPDGWPGSREEILQRLLTAQDWAQLFVT